MTVSFAQHAYYVTAAFVLKVFVTKMLGVRVRVQSLTYAWPEDEQGLKLLMPIIKIALVATPQKVSPNGGLNNTEEYVKLLERYAILQEISSTAS